MDRYREFHHHLCNAVFERVCVPFFLVYFVRFTYWNDSSSIFNLFSFWLLRLHLIEIRTSCWWILCAWEMEKKEIILPLRAVLINISGIVYKASSADEVKPNRSTLLFIYTRCAWLRSRWIFAKKQTNKKSNITGIRFEWHLNEPISAARNLIGLILLSSIQSEIKWTNHTKINAMLPGVRGGIRYLSEPQKKMFLKCETYTAPVSFHIDWKMFFEIISTLSSVLELRICFENSGTGINKILPSQTKRYQSYLKKKKLFRFCSVSDIGHHVTCFQFHCLSQTCRLFAMTHFKIIWN